MGTPLVSVFILTYNHKDYIRKTLESVLIQKVNFDYEIIIGDDFSNDGTREVLINYRDNNPDKIILNLLSEKGKGMIGHENFIKTYEMCRGKYIAFLDGDDYWIDESKLQKQVDFLETNSSYVICHHDCEALETVGIKLKKEFNETHKVTTFYDLCQITAPFMSSVVMKKEAIAGLDLRYWLGDLELGDFALWILGSMRGDAYYFSDVMGFYRVNTVGVTRHLGYEVQTRNRIRLGEKLLKSSLIFDRRFLHRFLCRYYFQSSAIQLSKKKFKRFFSELFKSSKNSIMGIQIGKRKYEWIKRLEWKTLFRVFGAKFIGAFKSA